MRKLNRDRQYELLRSNFTSRMGTLGNTFFNLTGHDLNKLSAAMDIYTTDVIYTAFYNWTEVPENKHARNLESFIVKDWIKRRNPEKTYRLPEPVVDHKTGLEMFKQIKENLNRIQEAVR